MTSLKKGKKGLMLSLSGFSAQRVLLQFNYLNPNGIENMTNQEIHIKLPYSGFFVDEILQSMKMG
jgi:hypothetical protein